MAEIRFDDEQEFARPAAYGSEPQGMAKLLIGRGLAKDERSATHMLIGIAIGAIVLAFSIVILAGVSKGHKPAFFPPDAANGQARP